MMSYIDKNYYNDNSEYYRSYIYIHKDNKYCRDNMSKMLYY